MKGEEHKRMPLGIMKTVNGIYKEVGGSTKINGTETTKEIEILERAKQRCHLFSIFSNFGLR